ncbi:MAG: hypothetical protein J6K43_06945 [Lachnospiraceae bacterium]|nr:hypothetical protein [Lachnospiraceae bacterium]
MDELYNLDLSKEYRPGIIDYSKYVNLLDGIPQWPDFAEHGFSWKQYLKFNKLLSIESTKYIYNHIEDYESDVSEGEKSEYMDIIDKMIKEYNALEVE